MGYNGGINKRGYYRRNNGMYKKSSSKFGEKLLKIKTITIFSINIKKLLTYEQNTDYNY
jgi:hypothetical protein